MNKELLNIIDEIYSESNKIMIIKEENIIKKWIDIFNKSRNERLEEKKANENKKKEKDKMDYYKFLISTCIKESDFRKDGEKKLVKEYKDLQKKVVSKFGDDVTLPPSDIINQKISNIKNLYGKNSIFDNHPEYGVISLPFCTSTPERKDDVVSFIKSTTNDEYTICWDYDSNNQIYYGMLVYKTDIASDFVYDEYNKYAKKEY